MNYQEALKTNKPIRRRGWSERESFMSFLGEKSLTEEDQTATDWESKPFGFDLLTDDEKKKYLEGRHRDYCLDVMRERACAEVGRMLPELVQEPESHFDHEREVDLSLLVRNSFAVALDAITKACGFDYFVRDAKLYVVPAAYSASGIDFEYTDADYVSDEELVLKFLNEKYSGYDWRKGTSFDKKTLPELLIQFHDWMISSQ